jgi:hypothetical protein
MQKVFLVSYDLRQPGRSYAALHQAIKALGSWAHPLESVWTVQSSLSAVQIRDSLVRHIDRNDGLLVTRLAGEAAWHGINHQEVENWLRTKLPRAA